MKPERICAFTDGVIAIIITIMVLELPVTGEPGLAALRPVLPLFAIYALSFTKVGIYWVNHHHLLCAARRIDGRVLLANLFQLFWLSLIPWVMRWIGDAGGRCGEIGRPNWVRVYRRLRPDGDNGADSP